MAGLVPPQAACHGWHAEQRPAAEDRRPVMPTRLGVLTLSSCLLRLPDGAPQASGSGGAPARAVATCWTSVDGDVVTAFRSAPASGCVFPRLPPPGSRAASGHRCRMARGDVPWVLLLAAFCLSGAAQAQDAAAAGEACRGACVVNPSAGDQPRERTTSLVYRRQPGAAAPARPPEPWWPPAQRFPASRAPKSQQRARPRTSSACWPSKPRWPTATSGWRAGLTTPTPAHGRASPATPRPAACAACEPGSRERPVHTAQLHCPPCVLACTLRPAALPPPPPPP